MLQKATVSLGTIYNPNIRNTRSIYVHNDNGKVLTNVLEHSHTSEYDNIDCDLICRVGDTIYVPSLSGRHVYVVESILGKGSFGQVLKCRRQDTFEAYAVKVVNSKQINSKHAIKEKRLLEMVFTYNFFYVERFYYIFL